MNREVEAFECLACAVVGTDACPSADQINLGLRVAQRGYGFVGVCNDSNAILEAKTKGTVSAFPLLRAKSLDDAAPLGDGLDDVIRALPNDGDGLADTRDALRRAVAMQPFADGSPLMWDAALGAQIATARRDATR